MRAAPLLLRADLPPDNGPLHLAGADLQMAWWDLPAAQHGSPTRPADAAAMAAGRQTMMVEPLRGVDARLRVPTATQMLRFWPLRSQPDLNRKRARDHFRV